MEKTTATRLDPRAVLAIVGLVFVVAAIWAATAFAGGSTPGAGTASAGWSNDPSPSVFVQDSNGNGAAPSRDDCPERDGSGGDSTPSDGSSSSGDGV